MGIKEVISCRHYSEGHDSIHWCRPKCLGGCYTSNTNGLTNNINTHL
jgi:hypothetical protein